MSCILSCLVLSCFSWFKFSLHFIFTAVVSRAHLQLVDWLVGWLYMLMGNINIGIGAR